MLSRKDDFNCYEILAIISLNHVLENICNHALEYSIMDE